MALQGLSCYVSSMCQSSGLLQAGAQCQVPGDTTEPLDRKEVAALWSKTDRDTVAFTLMYTQGQDLKLH